MTAMFGTVSGTFSYTIVDGKLFVVSASVFDSDQPLIRCNAPFYETDVSRQFVEVTALFDINLLCVNLNVLLCCIVYLTCFSVINAIVVVHVTLVRSLIYNLMNHINQLQCCVL
jgi:ABC-type protease/lipase transport system fused ATPase/permease subunit